MKNINLFIKDFFAEKIEFYIVYIFISLRVWIPDNTSWIITCNNDQYKFRIETKDLCINGKSFCTIIFLC